MREFFRGWKRKFGVVGLGLACLLTAGWIRSIAIADNTDFFSWTFSGVRKSLFSTGGYFGSIVDDEGPDALDVSPHIGSTTTHTIAGFSSESTVVWRAFGFFFVMTKTEVLVAAPCWSIILPLTLFSAYCLLTKPRTKPVSKSESASA